MRKPLGAGKTLSIVRTLAAVPPFAAVALLAPAAFPAGDRVGAPRLLDLRVGNGGSPFAGDRRLLTTVSPNGDGLRERVVVRFRLARRATVRAEAVRTETFKLHPRFERVVWSDAADLAAGRHRIVWQPPRSSERR